MNGVRFLFFRNLTPVFYSQKGQIPDFQSYDPTFLGISGAKQENAFRRPISNRNFWCYFLKIFEMTPRVSEIVGLIFIFRESDPTARSKNQFPESDPTAAAKTNSRDLTQQPQRKPIPGI